MQIFFVLSNIYERSAVGLNRSIIHYIQKHTERERVFYLLHISKMFICSKYTGYMFKVKCLNVLSILVICFK